MLVINLSCLNMNHKLACLPAHLRTNWVKFWYKNILEPGHWRQRTASTPSEVQGPGTLAEAHWVKLVLSFLQPRSINIHEWESCRQLFRNFVSLLFICSEWGQVTCELRITISVNIREKEGCKTSVRARRHLANIHHKPVNALKKPQRQS